jgi:predicted nucleic acid-binding protein
MRKKYSIVIVDTSCFKLLDRINELDLFTGTLRIFLKAKQVGILPSIQPLIEKIQQTNFRFSEKVLTDILKEANE